MKQPTIKMQEKDRPVYGSQAGHMPKLGLTVRCIVEKANDQWQAFSLEFGLAAQADSLEEAKRKLDQMIQWYVHDALVGEDREHAYELLTRRAPWQKFVRYYFTPALGSLGVTFGQVYHDPLPLEPKGCLS